MDNIFIYKNKIVCYNNMIIFWNFGQQNKKKYFVSFKFISCLRKKVIKK